MTTDPHPVTYHPPPDTGLEIIHLDDSLLVLDKPSGLLSVPGRGEEKQDSLASRAQAEYPEARVVHRLDMSTSGLMIMARGPDMQRRLQRLFEQRAIEKKYLAVVNGCPEPPSGTIRLPLITDWPNRPRQRVDHELGKPAVTRYRLMAYRPESDSSRVELRPETGRSHQLRVHMLAIGHVILGDSLYASPDLRSKAPRLLLHASALHFIHPASGRAIELHSRAPF
ncbi:MAG: pseudouridine synthase [Sedimenticola sp.]|nr:pseudouridine synthase [Sedimenticola sp.]